MEGESTLKELTVWRGQSISLGLKEIKKEAAIGHYQNLSKLPFPGWIRFKPYKQKEERNGQVILGLAELVRISLRAGFYISV